MLSAVVRKSVTDLTRRPARTLVAVAALALAVASVGIFALPPLTDREMRDEIAASRLADLTVETAPVVLGAADLVALRALPGVEAVEPRSSYVTRVFAGERRAEAVVIGVRDFARQEVDVVAVASGSPPASGAVLTDVQNARGGSLDVSAGDAIRIVGSDGSVRPLRVSGEGRNLGGGQEVISEGTIVLYASPRTVAELSGTDGFDALSFRLRDTGGAAVERTVAEIRDYLRAETAFAGFTELPSVRASGDWPGKQELEDFSTVAYIVTILALLSALVLISNTMTTLVGEQTGEIGTMKAVGARRRQIAGVYMRTAFLLGAVGTLVGSLLGVLLANALVRYFGSTFFAIETGFGVDVPVLLAGLALGLLGPPLAALPATRRAVRLSVREAIEAAGSAIGGDGRVDRALRAVGFLPRTAQIGLRGAGRRKRRSLATVLQVALAVATLLAFLGLTAGVTETTRRSWRDHGWDIWIGAGTTTAREEPAAAIIAATPGVAGVEPVRTVEVELRGHEAFIWGTASETLLRYRIAHGRWYGAADEQGRRRVGVIERNLARATGVGVGDRVHVETPGGPVAFRVIGVAANQQEAGTVLFVPLTTLRSILPSESGGYWVKTTSRDHALIDRTATRVEDALAAAGYEVDTEIPYVAARDEEATNRTLTRTITVLGLLIVALSMVGLVGAITMSVLERTREIGILRCLGARAGDVRGIFAAEGLGLVVLGWLCGIPLGYALDRLLVRLIEDQFDLDLVFAFPARNLLLALAGTVVLALAIMLAPLRRAVRLRPGEALRHA